MVLNLLKQVLCLMFILRRHSLTEVFHQTDASLVEVIYHFESLCSASGSDVRRMFRPLSWVHVEEGSDHA